jgi:uncharacterized caspase-like protein
MNRFLSRRTFTTSTAALAFTGGAWAQAPQAKFALIIANSDYDGDGRVDASTAAVTRAQERGFVGDLANPWFDSVRVGEALRGAGFSVETIYNANRAMMSGSIARVRARAAAAGPKTALVIYYAGHGVQLGGRTYLVASGARITAEMPAETSTDRDRIGLAMGVSVQMLLTGVRQIEAPGYELLLIDACRDNPWEERVRQAFAEQGRTYVGERGFGAMSVPSRRMIVGFSAQPGQLAKDGISAASSPFASAIARRAGQRGLAIDQMLQSAMGEVAAASGATQIPNIHGRFGDGTSLMP